MALRGALGAMSRFGVGWRFRPRYLHPVTFLVNVIGVLFVRAERGTLSESARLRMSVEFLGVFNAFSAFLFQRLRDIQEGQALGAVVYA